VNLGLGRVGRGVSAVLDVGAGALAQNRLMG
jgi:hypothetical protein